MKKYIVMAEEGEKKLIREVETKLGEQLNDYELILTGVGAVNVLRALRDIDKDAQLLNIGYAGSANFEVGSLVEVTDVRLNHPNVNYPEPELHLVTKAKKEGLLQARCYTNTDFVLASDYKDCVFDMELAFIAGLGFEHLRAIKYVSDNLSLHSYREHSQGVE